MLKSAFTTFEEKQNYFTSFVIDTEDKLERFVNYFERVGSSFIFRGVREAKFRLFTSGQQAFDISKPKQSYCEYIKGLIDTVKDNEHIESYFVSKGYPLTDFLILALLQHYGYPSPLLDFSYKIRTALFFACDGMINGKSDNSIDDYCSIYLLNLCDSEFVDILKMNQNACGQIEEILKNNEGVTLSDQLKRDLRDLPLDEYENISYALIPGGKRSEVNLEISNGDFACDYKINNQNMISQDGLFMYLSSANQSLEDLVKFNTSCNKHIICVNINKKLKAVIENNYLKPRNISRSTIYPNDIESQDVKQWLNECGLKTMKEIRL